MHNFWLPTVSKNNTAALRQFGLAMALLLTLLFFVVIPWISESEPVYWFAVVVLFLLIAALIHPRLLFWPYRGWMVIASLLNYVNTRVIMAIAYFLLIVPIGLLMKSIGKLQYTRRPVREASTYWVSRHQSPDKNNLKEPF